MMLRTAQRSALLIVTLLVVLGCTERDPDADPPGLSVVDSAGVTVVTNGPRQAKEPPHLRLVEEVRVGDGSDDEVEGFFRLMDVAVGSSGEIYALDSGTFSVRVFGPDGVERREFGGRGAGPGEFQLPPYRIAVDGDTVVVQDRAWFHWFSTSGEFLGRVQQAISGNEPLAELARHQERWVVGVRSFTPMLETGNLTVHDSLRVSRVDLTAGEIASEIVVIPSTTRRYLPDGRSRSQWMGPQATGRVGPQGRIYTALGDAFEVRVFGADGELQRVIRAQVDPEPLRNADLEQAIEQEIQESPDPALAFGIDEIRALGAPDHEPIVGDLLVAPDGGISIHRLDLSSPDDGDGRAVWDVLDAEGQLVGRFEVPPSSRVRAFDGAHVYATERDSLDVTSIVRYRIEAG